MRKGRNTAQASLNRALDDLLGGDEDEVESPATRPKSANQKAKSTLKQSSTNPARKGGLTSSSSNKDFYKNLSALTGQDIEEDDQADENFEVTSADAAKVASNLANMDDLESDLFGSFGSKKNTGASSSSKAKKKASDFSDFDEDDPLAGLGLSDDDDDDILSRKSKPKRQEPLSRKFSHSSSKGKVDPNLSNSIESPRRDKLLMGSTSFEKEDPFLATDPRPRSGSGDKKLKRMNSWDDPSIATQSGSESELTPRSRSNSGSQLKRDRKGSNRKKKVNPSPPKNESPVHNSQDTLDAPIKDTKQEKLSDKSKKTMDSKSDQKAIKSNKKQENNDIFADEDDLPGLSDDETILPKVKTVSRRMPEDEPTRKASSALSDLLGNKSKLADTKTRKPTFLEQMMSKNSTGGQNNGPSPMETDSPVVSPREKDVKFGGYSPSAVGSKERPTTAPNKRSVRFADELGFDDLDSSFSESRPSSAPESGRSRKGVSRHRSLEQSFSFDEEATDVSLEVKDKEIKKSPVKKGTPTLEVAKEKATPDRPSSQNGSVTGRKTLQNSRRGQASFGSFDEPESKEDWLGLGDGRDFHSPTRARSPSGRGSPSTSSNIEKKATDRTEADDWLGLGGEEQRPNDPSNLGKEITPTATVQENVKAENAVTAEAKNPSISTKDDSLFPWEMSGPTSKQRRRERTRRFGEATLGIGDDDITGDSRQQQQLDDSAKEPVSHSTPKQAEEVATSSQTKATPNKKTPSSSQQEGIKDPQSSSHNKLQNQPQINNSTPSKTQKGVQGPLDIPTLDGSFAAQVIAAERILSMAQAPSLIQGSVLPQIGLHGGLLNEGANVSDVSLMAKQLETVNSEKLMQQRKIEEYDVEKSHSEDSRRRLESEFRDLQSRVVKMEEGQMKAKMDYTKTIQELEAKVRKYELEIEQWKASQSLMQKRHDEEVKAMETSYKTRFKILEDTYERRETQLKEEHEYSLKILNEKLKAAGDEKRELAAFNKKKIEMVERNKDNDMERIKEIHKKVLEDMKGDYEDQLERLRMLKEQEVAAATSMFSQTKSLQSLIQQVQNSASEVDQLQQRVGLSHKTDLGEREYALKARDEYLKSMQERLHRQETENIEERSRLQRLIAKLEMQLQEQNRQQDQDKWKINQDENRIKSMQTALEAERRSTLQQLSREREMVDNAREELSRDQKNILAECYEERQKISMEKSKLENSQMRYNRNNLEKEYESLQGREAKVLAEEQRLERERKIIEESFIAVNKEKDNLEELAKQIQSKSREIEELSQVARRIQQEGIDSLEHSNSMKMELSRMSNLLESRASAFQEKENILLEERASLEVERRNFEREKETSKCFHCRRPLAVQYSVLDSAAGNLESRAESDSSNSPISSVAPSTTSEMPRVSGTHIQKAMMKKQPLPHTPDLLINGLEFNRKLRKWSADREQDEEFFEEENRYLNDIQQKRERSLKNR